MLRRLGAEVVDPANVAGVKALSEPEWTVLLYEFKADLNDFLRQLGPDAPVHSLAEAIAFNQAHAELVMPFFGQEAFEQSQAKGTLDDAAYREALATCRRLARDEGIDATLEEHALDAIIAPSGGPAWLTDWVNGDHFGGQLDAGSGRRLPQHHGARGSCVRAASGHFLFRRGLPGSDTAAAGLCL